MAKLTNDSNNQTYIYHQLMIYNSHTLKMTSAHVVKPQSMSTTVLFRTTLTHTITLNRLRIRNSSFFTIT